MPIEESLFDRIKNGTAGSDNMIKASEILPFRSHQRVKIYLMSIGIDPEALQGLQGLMQEPLEKLLYGFFDKLIWYAIDRKIRVTEFVAVGWTAKGEKLCTSFEMEKVATDPYGHPIYWIDLSDTQSLLKKKGLFASLKRLLKTYQDLGL